MLAVIASFVFMLLCIGAFAFSFAHDRSWYRNCYLMFMSFLSVIPFALNAMGSFGKPVIVVLADIVLIAMLLTPYFLIHNGIVMIKKEGAASRTFFRLVLAQPFCWDRQSFFLL